MKIKQKKMKELQRKVYFKGCQESLKGTKTFYEKREMEKNKMKDEDEEKPQFLTRDGGSAGRNSEY